MEETANGAKGEVGLVLAGGGARGAYELGALRELMRHLDEADHPRIIVGTSAGAINAAYLAATADRPLGQALQDGCELWLSMMQWEKVLKPLVSWAELRLALSSIGDAFRIPKVRSYSLLDPTPLRTTLGEKIPVGRIADNVRNDKLTAAGLVATRAATSLSLVFYDTNGKVPANDVDRGIDYERTARFSVDHVLASAAIPAAFPAVQVESPGQGPVWYFDGGTRLNTPIKPALDLGAERLIIVALNDPKLGRKPTKPRKPERPTIIDGATQLVQGLLIDPLVNDIHNLTTINELVAGGGKVPGKTYERVAYMLITPDGPNRIGELAYDCYKRRYKGWKSLSRRYHSVARLARLLDVDDEVRGELLSYLFFDEEFAEALLDEGRRDAQGWLAQKHDVGPWRYRKL